LEPRKLIATGEPQQLNNQQKNKEQKDKTWTDRVNSKVDGKKLEELLQRQNAKN